MPSLNMKVFPVATPFLVLAIVVKNGYHFQFSKYEILMLQLRRWIVFINTCRPHGIPFLTFRSKRQLYKDIIGVV